MTDVVQYQAVRDEIKTGDLLVWSTDNNTVSSAILTHLVRLLTLSEYSHTAIALVDQGRVYAVEATIPKIKLTALSQCKDFYHIPMGIVTTPEQHNVLKQYIETTYLDCSYSLLDCIRGYLGKTDTRNDRWQCAELCNDFYKYMGIDLGDAYTPSKIIKAVIQQRGATMRYIAHG